MRLLDLVRPSLGCCGHLGSESLNRTLLLSLSFLPFKKKDIHRKTVKQRTRLTSKMGGSGDFCKTYSSQLNTMSNSGNYIKRFNKLTRKADILAQVKLPI